MNVYKKISIKILILRWIAFILNKPIITAKQKERSEWKNL